MADMEFGLLGPLVARTSEVLVRVPHGHQRTVLALLLLETNRVVSVDQIAEVLWGDAPPPSAEVIVRNLVRRLRHTLGDADRSRISAGRRGYLLRVGTGELDLAEFEALIQSARKAAHGGCWERAAGQARAALALWRGEPLAEVDSDTLTSREAPRLIEMRWEVLEIRIDADLHLGQHRELVAELRRLAAAHPLREQVHAFLMLALYRCGRQGEALATYQHARAVLARELGTEPGAILQLLHQQVLTADPALAAPQPARSTPPADLPASPATTAAEAPQSAAVVPRQLPGSVAFFAGRTAELAMLAGYLDDLGDHAPGTVVVSAIGGTGGVGKTALAVHWAHQVADQFPGGQLYVNLRAFDPSGTPVTPAEAVRGFLDALGVPADQIPQEPSAQAGLYRSLLAGRRLLILLDNAADEQQVRPLLPGTTGGCLALVTSRNQLAGLAATEGARLISLDLLSAADSRSLLTARLGTRRAAAEPDAVDEITQLCARLPLALAVAAARAAARPGIALAGLAAELRESATRLDALDAGDPAASVRAVFSWSTRQLAPPAAGMFRLLGLHPGPDITVPAAASLAAADLTSARHLLARLARAHLITEHAGGRYAFHDLLRAYAGEQARATVSASDRHEATGRLLDYYLHTAVAAARLLNPAHEPIALAPQRAGAVQWQPADYRQAMAWFEDEHPVLVALIALAAESGFDAHAWQLASATAAFLQARGHYQEMAAIQRIGLTTASGLGDTAARALSGRLLATACLELGDLELALDHFATSLTLYQQLGDYCGEAKIQQSLGVIAERQGRYADSLRRAEQALRLYQAIGDKASQGAALNNVGMSLGELGDYQQARVFARQALVLSEEVGNGWLIGCALDTLGYAEHHLGDFATASQCFQRSLVVCREVGERWAEATALTHLGENYQATHDFPQAHDAWQQALAILEDLHHPDAEHVRARLCPQLAGT